MLAIPPCGASSNIALWRAKIKPPVELVVGDLERIREIRASERRAYQKITDIFEQCSYNYDKSSEIRKNFYAFVQNKLHFSIIGRTE